MKKGVVAVFMLVLVLAGFRVSVAAEQDVKGGRDHALLSRMPDFRISEYNDNDFESHRFIDHDKKQVIIEGHKYYIEYRLNKGAVEPGELKIRRNIQDALRKIGGTVVFDDNFNKISTIVLRKGGKETWVEVRAYNNMYRLTIVEKETMKQEVIADAQAMGNDINTTGRVLVYGIYFDTGKSEIKPESDSAISEIATLLRNNGALNIYIVGHTDNVGSIDFNMKLSRDRADAVSEVLTSRYGITPERLKSFGVASLSPVASNDTEDGRAKNRRVELVKQ